MSNLDNIFFFKKIVDLRYPQEEGITVVIEEVVNEVREMLSKLSDEDFSEVITCCFIPDLYSGMGKREKLFTKLTELMVGEWWRRMGGSFNLPKKKSGTEDVELLYGSISIVCDAKVFRLGRSQTAPNVKDFLKLQSVREWIDNRNTYYKERQETRKVIGGLVTYSSLHEWEKDSEVYSECTNYETPVVMLPYEVLALLLKYKSRIKLYDLAALWDYQKNNVIKTKEKRLYWDYVNGFICRLLNITKEQYEDEINSYRKEIVSAVAYYRAIVQAVIDETRDNLRTKFSKFTSLEELIEHAIQEIEERDNAVALDYLKRIDEFRVY